MLRPNLLTSLLALSLTVSGSGTALASTLGQDATGEAAPPLTAQAGLEISVTGGVWLPRARGEASLGAAGTTVQVDDDLGLNSHEATANFEVAVRTPDGYELLFSGFDFDADNDGVLTQPALIGGVAFAPGDPFRASLDVTSVSAELGLPRRRVTKDDGDGIRPPTSELLIAPQLALRYLDADLTTGRPGGVDATGESEWLLIQAGLGVEMLYRPEGVPLLHMLEMEAVAATGPALGGDGGWGWQLRAGVIWHFNPGVSAMVGFRLVEIDAEDDDFEYDVILQGLYLAGSIRF